jgi:hypothetical protein
MPSFDYFWKLDEVRATSGANLCRPLFLAIGPSGVRALPLAAGINKGGHYFRYFGPSVVRAPAVST